jgi:hypothetical protein
MWPTADAQQRTFITAARDHGFVIYDRSGGAPSVSVGFVGGSQWAGSTLGQLNIAVSDLELVTA